MSIIGTLPPWELMTISLLDAGAADAVADVEPELRRRLPGRGQGAGRGDVLVRLADRLDGQEGHRQVIGEQFDRAGDHALGDRGVGGDRQMRPVLLDRGDRQNGDPVRRIALDEIAGSHVLPVAGGYHAECPGLHPVGEDVRPEGSDNTLFASRFAQPTVAGQSSRRSSHAVFRRRPCRSRATGRGAAPSPRARASACRSGSPGPPCSLRA